METTDELIKAKLLLLAADTRRLSGNMREMARAFTEGAASTRILSKALHVARRRGWK